MLEVGVYELPPSPTLVPPLLAVYHPLNVYSDLVGVGNVVLLAVHLAYNVVSFVKL